MASFFRRQRLTFPLALVAAAVLGCVFAVLVALIPGDTLEAMVVDSGIAAIVSAAEPPLGLTARLAAMVLVGGGVTMFAWFGFFLIVGSRTISIGQPSSEEGVPVLRRADAHPDAPARRPLFATQDLGTPFLDVRAQPSERAIPENLDLPIAAFDPRALRAEPLVMPEPIAPLNWSQPAPEPEAPPAWLSWPEPEVEPGIEPEPVSIVVPEPEPVVEPVAAAEVEPVAIVAVASVPEPAPAPIDEPETVAEAEPESDWLPLPRASFGRFETFGQLRSELPPLRMSNPAPTDLAPSPSVPRIEVPAVEAAPAPEPAPKPIHPEAASIHALLDRLERGAARKASAAVKAAEPTPASNDGLQDTLGMLRRLATGG